MFEVITMLLQLSSDVLSSIRRKTCIDGRDSQWASNGNSKKYRHLYPYNHLPNLLSGLLFIKRPHHISYLIRHHRQSSNRSCLFSQNKHLVAAVVGRSLVFSIVLALINSHLVVEHALIRYTNHFNVSVKHFSMSPAQEYSQQANGRHYNLLVLKSSLIVLKPWPSS